MKNIKAVITIFYKKEGLMFNRTLKMETSRSALTEELSKIIRDEDFENIQVNIRGTK